MKAAETTVLRLLQGEKVFLIPNFQRRYAWRRTEWQDLWDDLVREYEVGHDAYSRDLDGHFLGSVVLHPAPGRASTLMRHLVVDGQQRLTTVLVLLAAIRDVRVARDEQWNPGAYTDKYLTNPYSEDYPDRLVPTEFDRAPYVATVRYGRPTGGIGQAYTFFRTEIEARLNEDADFDLGRLGETLLMHMLLVEISTSAGDSVNAIFNTLNSKGLPLSATDLIRNELLLNLDESAANSVYRGSWLPMETALVRVDRRGNLNDAAMVTFFWAREVAESPGTTKKNTFQAFERRLRRRLDAVPASGREQAVLDYVDEIVDDFRLYQTLLAPKSSESSTHFDREVRDALEQLRLWASEPYVPIALWLVRECAQGKVSQEDTAEALRLLLSYLVRRALTGLPTNNLNRMLSPIPTVLAGRADGVPVAAALAEALSRPAYRWPTDSDVLESVAGQPLYLSIKRSQTKFILATVERLLSGPEAAQPEELTVEHLLPQSLPQAWEETLRLAGDSIEEAEALIHTLGNLTLSGYNSELGIEPFALKKEKLAHSALRLNRELSEVEKWGPAEIRERSLSLARRLLSQYSAPSGSREVRDVQPADALVRVMAALQSLPAGGWTTESELVKYLGADRHAVRATVSALGPELVRLVRDESGAIPGWLSAELRSSVTAQGPEGEPSPDNRVSAEAIADVVLRAAGEDAGILDDELVTEA